MKRTMGVCAIKFLASQTFCLEIDGKMQIQIDEAEFNEALTVLGLEKSQDDSDDRQEIYLAS